MPKIDIAAAPHRVGIESYPEPFRSRVGAVERRALGRAAGLTTLGVNLTRLHPGQMTALRHWHEREDELVFILFGRAVLVEEGRETEMAAGDAAGFPANHANGHHLVNRGDAPADLLEIGPRLPDERGHYPDDELALVREAGVSHFGPPSAPTRREAVPGGSLIDISAAPVTVGSDYPAPLDAEFAGRKRIRLGDAAALSQFGVSLTRLPAGARSSLRHWHEVEDEMVFVLSGTLTLIDEAGETPIGPGEAAGFPGGERNAHQFVNRGAQEAEFLEIGTRPREDRCHYAEHDLICHDCDGATWFSKRDGTPVTDPKERFE